MFEYFLSRLRKDNCKWQIVKNHRIGNNWITNCGCEYQTQGLVIGDRCVNCKRIIEIITKE